MMGRDLYEVLGVPRTADQAELKRAFRKAARLWHPDVNQTPEAEDKFAEISSAYQTLSDPDKRARYDRFGEAGLGANGSLDGVEILQHFFSLRRVGS